MKLMGYAGLCAAGLSSACDSVATKERGKVLVRQRAIPPIDLNAPEKVETATFSLG